jgi:hypothetical protein
MTRFESVGIFILEKGSKIASDNRTLGERLRAVPNIETSCGG